MSICLHVQFDVSTTPPLIRVVSLCPLSSPFRRDYSIVHLFRSCRSRSHKVHGLFVVPPGPQPHLVPPSSTIVWRVWRGARERYLSEPETRCSRILLDGARKNLRRFIRWYTSIMLNELINISKRKGKKKIPYFTFSPSPTSLKSFLLLPSCLDEKCQRFGPRSRPCRRVRGIQIYNFQYCLTIHFIRDKRMELLI